MSVMENRKRAIDTNNYPISKFSHQEDEKNVPTRSSSDDKFENAVKPAAIGANGVALMSCTNHDSDVSNISDCNTSSIRVLSGSTLTNMVSAMQWQAYGLYYIKVTEYFAVSKAAGGWAGSLCIATSCLAGLFLTPVIKKINARWTSALCGLFLFLGMVSSSFSPNIQALTLSYGLIAGFGVGGSMLCGVTEVQQTFTRHRPLAQGIAYLGYSLSNVLSPIMLAAIIRTFRLRGAMLIHAAIALNMIPFSFFYRRTNEVVVTKNLEVSKEQLTAKQSSSRCSSLLCHGFWCVLSFLRDIFDFSSLKNPVVLLYSIACLVHRSCAAVILMNIPSRAVSVGMTFAEGAYLMSGYSCGNFSGRVIITFISNLSCVNLVLLTALCTAFAGIFGCVMSLWNSFYISIALCFSLGIFQGSVNTLLPSVLTELCGTENIARLQAVTTSFGALPILLMPPFSGFLYTIKQSYILPYFVCGLTELSVTFLLLTMYCLNRRQKRTSDSSI